MKVKIKPLQDRVLIKRSKAQVTVGGIILPDTAQEKPQQGEVVAVGPGREDKNGKTIAMSLKVGDKVLFTAYSGTEFQPQNDDEEYIIMTEDDILAVVQ
jgi:chaperonin GroES